MFTILLTTCLLGVYDGAQTNNVIGVSDLANAETATLSCRVQTQPDANRTWKVLAICGDPLKPGWMRLSYNVRREGRIWGTFGDVRVCSEPQVLGDGKLHHVALEVSPGKKLKLFVDGREVASAPAPQVAIAGGPLSVGQRVVVGSADDAWYYETGRAQHFRGRIIDAAAARGAFDPQTVAGGVAPREMDLTIPPNPLETVATWERPKTTRRYLQGPFSERLLVYFREGKILFGENEHKDDWSVAYGDLVSHAVWLVHGGEDLPFDFRQAALSCSEGGEPDCAQTWKHNRMEVKLSACAPWGRRPSAHLRLEVRNLADYENGETFGFMVRCAKEKDLVMGAPDVYESYDPKIEDWRKLGFSDWVLDGRMLRSGDRFVTLKTGDFDWDAKAGVLRFKVSLKPGEVRTFDLEVGRGESDAQSFDAAHAAMVREWTRELAKLKLPLVIDMDPAQRRLIRHLAVQMLQCFAYPVGADYALPRQGGLQRYVWPGDAISFLSAMDELGYGDYVSRTIDFYFERCLRPSGEAGPFKNRWACDTGCVLETFAKHVLLTNDQACWRKHRDAAFRAFDWIESKRREGGGLFPSMKSTDHGAASRHWGMTDMYSLLGLEDFSAAAARMNDSRAAEVQKAAEAYRAAINRVLDGWKAKAAGRDELMIPLTAEGETDDALIEDYMFVTHYGKFADGRFLSPEDMLRVRTWMLRRKYADENGLYSNQVSRRGQVRDEHVWYTTWQDQHWFNAWLRVGRRDLADKTLQSTLKFALTDEFLVGERYHDYDPWYYPWSPNASGSGRIVQMIFSAARGSSEIFASSDEAARAKTETAFWQAKIDAAAAAGGGRVTVGPGRHEVGQLNLRNNVELHLESGAVLEGAYGLEHYGVLSLPYSEGTWSAVVMAVGCTNVAVTGEGLIDGRGGLWPQPNPYVRNQEGHRPRGMLFADCVNVRLEDFTLKDAACWGIVVKCCDGVTARRVKIDNHANINNDGFDLEGRNILIEDCDVDSGDDAYCFKANNPNFVGGNIVVRNCTGRSHSTCYKLGTGTHGTIKGLRIENCRALTPRRDFIRLRPGPNQGKPFFYRAEYAKEFPNGIGKTALSFQNCDGGDITDLVVDGLEFESYVVPFTIRGAERLIRPPRIPPNTLRRFGNITIRNLRGKTASPNCAWICGVDGIRVKGVKLENVDVELIGSGAKVRPTVEQKTDTDHNPPGYGLFAGMLTPGYGLYIDKADDIELVNVNFRLRPGTEDFRPAIYNSASPEGIPGLISPDAKRNLYLRPEWRRRFRTLKSSADGSRQPFYWYDPGVTNKVPLVVAFHSWGASCHWTSPAMGVQAYCERQGWAMVYPNFRGPNVRPDACGSELACVDVLDVIEWAQKERAIDADRIYLIGGSGGGYFSLLMAGRFPEIFAGAAAFCPITDLARWYRDGRSHYPKNIAAACGGTPEESPYEYSKRSALTYLSNARVNRLPIYIVTGIHDGHTGSVPVGHSIRAFNTLADEADRISEADIAEIERTEKVPEALAFKGRDPFYGSKTPIWLRKTSANARLTIFEAGHDGNTAAGLDFLSRQRRGRSADMTIPNSARAGRIEGITK